MEKLIKQEIVTVKVTPEKKSTSCISDSGNFEISDSQVSDFQINSKEKT